MIYNWVPTDFGCSFKLELNDKNELIDVLEVFDIPIGYTNAQSIPITEEHINYIHSHWDDSIDNKNLMRCNKNNMKNQEKKQCEVNIHFKVPKDKADHIFNARRELIKAGITFDTGGWNDGEFIELDWEFDWSLKGNAEVNFKKYKQNY